MAPRKKKTTTKSKGSKGHFFSEFKMGLIDEKNENSNLEVKLLLKPLTEIL